MNDDENIEIKKKQKIIEREYKHIPIILKRYSFANKITICRLHSLKLLKENNIKISIQQNEIPPWILETFALFAIMTDKEYDKKEFIIKNDKTFYKIINTISNYIHPEFTKVNKEELLNNLFMILPIQQFKYQNPDFFKIFRYNYFFSFINEHINMPEEFQNKFNASYNEFIDFGFFVITFLPNNFSNKVLYYVINNKYKTVIKNLMINRKNFIQKQNDLLSNNINSYFYAFKYFSNYPFIEENKIIYFPLPHLIIEAVTDSLLYRLTEQNNNLRALIGKEVIENYLFEILKVSGLYDEVKKEQSYYIGKNKIMSPDVMLYKDNVCVLFDCKSSVPKLKLREFDKNAIEETINLSAQRIVKLYDRLKEFGEYYYPFSKDNTFKLGNIFGVIILLENNFISKKIIYEKAIQYKKLYDNEIEKNYLQSNVKIISMNEIEYFTFYNKNIITALTINRDQIENANWHDMIMTNYNIPSESKIRNKLLESCDNELKERMYKLVDELTENGLLKK